MQPSINTRTVGRSRASVLTKCAKCRTPVEFAGIMQNTDIHTRCPKVAMLVISGPNWYDPRPKLMLHSLCISAQFTCNVKLKGTQPRLLVSKLISVRLSSKLRSPVITSSDCTASYRLRKFVNCKIQLRANQLLVSVLNDSSTRFFRVISGDLTSCIYSEMLTQ